MANYLPIEFAGEILWLLPEKAVYWPSRQALLLADLHLGKGEVFRRQGIPVPAGSTRATLARISFLLGRHAVDAVYFLGDLFHDPRLVSNALVSELLHWRDNLADLRLFLVPGNHDKTVAELARQLAIDLLAEPYPLSPFHLVHNTGDFNSDFRIGGHVHPVYWLKYGYRRKARLPCFFIDDSQLILPAFGDFTGGFAVEKKRNIKLFTCCEDRIFEI